MLLGAFTGLFNSEKALAGGVLIVCATILAAMGQMSVADWQDYTKWIFGIYVFGKTTQGAVATIASSKSAAETSSSASSGNSVAAGASPKKSAKAVVEEPLSEVSGVIEAKADKKKKVQP